jgi:hypothetical protein
LALIDYNGQIYSLDVDDADEFESVGSQKTMLKVTGSFGFL